MILLYKIIAWYAALGNEKGLISLNNEIFLIFTNLHHKLIKTSKYTLYTLIIESTKYYKHNHNKLLIL